MIVHSKFLIALALIFLNPGNALSAELEFHFSGTLERARNCDPSSDAFCGPFTGTLRIDDSQVGRETTPFSYDYTGNVVITFADSQTASCRSHPSPLSEEINLYLWNRTRFCLISVESHPENIRIVQLSIRPMEQEVLSVGLRYTYEAVAFDITNLTQVLEYVEKPPFIAIFSVVGKACSWGPCVDRSVTPLTMLAISRE